MDHPCFFCGGAAHPATGHAYSERVLACRRCIEDAFRFVVGHTSKGVGRRRRDGTERPRTASSFYEAAVLFQTEKE